MSAARVGYVVKRYPRFSETFIVNEILAHEAAGADLEIFSIRPCNDTHFQNTISQVRAPLTRLSHASVKWSALWPRLQQLGPEFPKLWDVLREEQDADAVTVSQAIELAQHVRERKITHLHAHFATLPAAVARLAAWIADISYSLTAHAKDIYHDSVDAPVLAARLNDASAIVTVSQFNIAYLTKQFPSIADRLHCVYNGLGLQGLAYQEPRTRKRQIIAVGRLVEKKGIGVLVEACAELRDRDVEFCCQIVGSGDEQAPLEQLIESRQLAGHVTLTGPLPQSEVIHRLHESAVFAAPCVVGEDGNRDGLPTVLLEAMAVGTPCVSTDVTGIPEVVQHGQTGLIVPQHDADALADALVAMLDDSGLRVRCAEAARALIEDKFDSRRTSQQIRELFHAHVECETSSSPSDLLQEVS